MTLTLSNLKPARGAAKSKKRVGRGGKRGTYSGRGLKGQKARSGVSGLKALGMRQRLLQIPKVRGFKSAQVKYRPINIAALEERFNAGETVDMKKFVAAGLASRGERVKVLGSGKLTKSLTVIAHDFSAGAREAITAAGGTPQIAS